MTLKKLKLSTCWF